jgi:hypothetical protein
MFRFVLYLVLHVVQKGIKRISFLKIHFLGYTYNTLEPVKSRREFWKILLSPSSSFRSNPSEELTWDRQQAKWSSKMPVDFQWPTRLCIPEDITTAVITSISAIFSSVFQRQRPPLWSRGPGSIPGTTWKKKIIVSGTGSTQPREYNWEATW